MRISVALALLAFCVSTAAAFGPPNYRVFRGYRRADVSVERFLSELGSTFIPAAPKTHQKNGLIAYVPAVLPQGATAGTPDEIAIVVYESPEVYAIARATPEGVAYGNLHWTLFEEPMKEGATPADHRTKSHSAVPFARDLKLDEPVDVFHRYVDWQQGHTTVFAGTKLPGMSKEAWLARVSQHVAMARDAFAGQGLDGYIAVVHSEGPHDLTQEIAWMHWTSEEAMNKAFASEAGKKVAADAAQLFKVEMWGAAPAFGGTIAPGQAVNVRFTPRPR